MTPFISLSVCNAYQQHIGGFSEQYGGVFAVPAIGEKGYLDTRVEVSSPGGHSSIPPSHTVGHFLCPFYKTA